MCPIVVILSFLLWKIFATLLNFNNLGGCFYQDAFLLITNLCELI